MAQKTFDPNARISRGTNVFFTGHTTPWLAPNEMTILDALPRAYVFVTGRRDQLPVHHGDFTLSERNGRHLTFTANI